MSGGIDQDQVLSPKADLSKLSWVYQRKTLILYSCFTVDSSPPRVKN